MFKNSVSALVIVFAVVCFSAKASAQPSADQVYSDIKSVIEDLITREVAQSVTPRLACHSRDGMLKYYPRTFQMLYERNYGVLKDAMRSETVDLFANYAFLAVDSGRAQRLSQFLPVTAPRCTAVDCCTEDVRRIGGPEHYNQRRQSEARRPGVSWKPLDVCIGLKDYENPKRALACNLILALADAGNARDTAALERATRAVGVAVSWPFIQGNRSQTRQWILNEVTQEVRELLRSGQVRKGGLLAALVDADPAQLGLLLGDAANADPNLFVKLLGTEDAANQVRAAFFLLRKQKPIVLYVDGVLAKDVDLVEVLRQFRDEDLSTVDDKATAIARRVLIHAGKSDGGKIEVNATTAEIQIRVSRAEGVAGSGVQLLADLRRAARLAQDLKRQLMPSHSALPIAEVERALIELAAMMRQLADEWHRMTTANNGRIDLVALIDWLVEASKNPQSCAQQAPSSGPARMAPTLCDFLKQLGALIDPRGDLRRVVRAAVQRNYRELAVTATRAVFSEFTANSVCCGRMDEAACRKRFDIYGRFAITFVSYALTSADDQDASVAARTAFKSAAYDLIVQTDATRSGLARPNFDGSLLKPNGFIVPTFALRASWNNGYVNSGDDGMRYVASAEWLNVRHAFNSSEHLYTGIQFSAIDLLGAVSELALRDAEVEFENETRVWLDMLSPRVEFVVGSPSLSRKLALSVGAMLRGAVPIETAEIDRRSGKREYPYVSWFIRDGDQDDDTYDERLMRSIEFSAAIKFYP